MVNIAVLKSIDSEADTLKIRMLNQIASEEQRILEQLAKEREEKENESGGGKVKEHGDKSGENPIIDTPPQIPKPKKQKNVSIKTVNVENTWRLESEDDVKKHLAELEKELLAQLEEDTVVNVEF